MARHLTDWNPIVIESPFKATEEHSNEVHRAYLERCLRDAVLRGETPYASHKMLTDAFNDCDPVERRIGINAGLAMARQLVLAGTAQAIFYIDYGWGEGMHGARDLYQKLGISYENRSIGKNPNPQ